MPSDRDNVNPTPEAVAAMWLHSDSYSRHCGGSMDFYVARTKSQQENCERMVKEIIGAAKAHGRL